MTSIVNDAERDILVVAVLNNRTNIRKEETVILTHDVERRNEKLLTNKVFDVTVSD